MRKLVQMEYGFVGVAARSVRLLVRRVQRGARLPFQRERRRDGCSDRDGWQSSTRGGLLNFG